MVKYSYCRIPHKKRAVAISWYNWTDQNEQCWLDEGKKYTYWLNDIKFQRLYLLDEIDKLPEYNQLK